MSDDKKGNVFSIENLLKQREFNEAQGQNKNFAAPSVSNEAMLILNALGNLQLSLNTIITHFSAILYAMRKNEPRLFELMQIGVKISEYVNRQFQIDQYRASPSVDLQLLSKLSKPLAELELGLQEKGIEYLEDAKSEYQRFLQTQKGS